MSLSFVYRSSYITWPLLVVRPTGEIFRSQREDGKRGHIELVVVPGMNLQFGEEDVDINGERRRIAIITGANG